jgi:NADH:ubiquinone oxidoreductase subunit 3 (subunit A)
MPAQTSGLAGYLWQNSDIILVFIQPWDVHHLKLFMGILLNTLLFLICLLQLVIWSNGYKSIKFSRN